MKIAILSSLYPPYSVGGAEKAANMLAEALVAQGLDVVMICLYPGTEEIVEDLHGVRVYRLPIDNARPTWLGGKRMGPLRRLLFHVRDTWNWSAARRVTAVLQRERPSILHTHGVSGFSVAVWAAARRLKIATVHTLHDYYALCPKTTLCKNGKVCERRCVECVTMSWPRKRASNQVDAVTGVSNAVLGPHLGQGYFAKSRGQAVVYNILQNAVPPAPLAHKALTFGFIGRVTAEKGIELLLQAMADLPEEPCQLKIAGTGDADYLEQLKQRYPDDRIEWLGFTRADTFLSMVDVVVIPSVWAEPLPYTCVESLLAGKSIIASDIGGITELVRLCALHRLIPAGDQRALVGAMREALGDSGRWRTGILPSADVVANFSEEKITRQYRDLYDLIAPTVD